MADKMDTMMDKAQTLIEALPYIREFSNKTVVVKYGGSAMLDEELKKKVSQDIALLKLVGMHPVIVLEANGVRAAGISGKDGNMLTVRRKTVDGQDIGFVGEVKSVNANLINTLIKNGYVPVIAPIGMDDDYQTYNINADDAACAIAEALSAEKLAFLTDIEGVYKDPKDPSTLLSVLTLSDAEKLIADGYVGGGMIPKLKNCIDAVNCGVSRVHILDGRRPHCLLLEFFTEQGVGTAIIDDVREGWQTEIN